MINGGFMARSQRHEALRKIILTQKISSQGELLKALAKAGHDVTQATLSRDLKMLRVGTVTDMRIGTYYVLPEDQSFRRVNALPETDSNSDREQITLHFSSSICVVHTRPAFAQPIAAAIDKHSIPGVMGTVAGHDTILIALHERHDAGVIEQTIRYLLSLL